MDFLSAFLQSNQQPYHGQDGTSTNALKHGEACLVRIDDSQSGSSTRKSMIWDAYRQDFQDPITKSWLRDQIHANHSITFFV